MDVFVKWWWVWWLLILLDGLWLRRRWVPKNDTRQIETDGDGVERRSLRNFMRRIRAQLTVRRLIAELSLVLTSPGYLIDLLLHVTLLSAIFSFVIFQLILFELELG